MTTPSLAIELSSAKPSYEKGKDVALRATYRNVGKEPFSLTFWWNRRVRIVDEQGKEIAPRTGPVLPCGGGPEEPTVLTPGGRFERDEPLACTQPAGDERAVGWSYDLAPGSYRAVLLFAFPPAHGRIDSDDARAWRGSVESNEVRFVVGR